MLPIVLCNEAPQRAPGIRPIEFRLTDRGAQARRRTIGGDDEIVGSVFPARAVTQPAAVLVDGNDTLPAMHGLDFGPRLRQQREQRTALHAEAEQARIESGIAHVHDSASVGVVAKQPVDPGTVLECAIEQAHFPQHMQADRLQQEAGADRAENLGLFENFDAMTVARQCDRCRLPRGSVTDDRDSQRRHDRVRAISPQFRQRLRTDAAKWTIGRVYMLAATIRNPDCELTQLRRTIAESVL